MAAAAVANLGVDTERSIRLALEAVETTYRADGTVLPEAEEVLHRAMQAQRLVLTVPGYSGTFSSDGSRLLTESLRQGTADVSAATTGELISTATGAVCHRANTTFPCLASAQMESCSPRRVSMVLGSSACMTRRPARRCGVGAGLLEPFSGLLDGRSSRIGLRWALMGLICLISGEEELVKKMQRDLCGCVLA